MEKIKVPVFIKQELDEKIEDLTKKIMTLSEDEEKISWLGFLQGVVFSLEMRRTFKRSLRKCISKVLKG